ncbi:MAG: ABC transporter ATP-binding protein, partial [Spirochaetota bacterium]
LLDEPLSALDAKIRVNLRAEIKKVQAELGITMIYVTHDQEEALSISDRVIVMNQGYVEQTDRPINIYKNPKTSFVADFVGTSNFFSGKLSGNLLVNKQTGVSMVASPESLSALSEGGGTISISIRPEKIHLYQQNQRLPRDQEKTNIKQGIIEVVTFLGVIVRVLVRMKDRRIIVDITEKDFERNLFKMGDQVKLYFPPEDFLAFQHRGGEIEG